MRFTNDEDEIIIKIYNDLAGNKKIMDVATLIKDVLDKEYTPRSIQSIIGRIYCLIHKGKLKWKSKLKV